MNLYDIPFVTPYMKKQLEKYKNEYQYSYSGMLRSLKYWYEVKKTPIDKNKGIGIIPYIYQDAYNYYYSIWLANQKSSERQFDYTIKDEVVQVRPPEKSHILKRLFNSIDKDEIE